MKIRELITVGVFLGLSGRIIVGARPSCYRHDQEKEQRPKFYSLRVVSEKNVQNAKDSLGAPDGRYAEILPGGQLVLLMEKELYLFPGIGWNPEGGGAPADSGSVVGKGVADFSLEGWLSMQDTQGKQDYDWIPLGLSATGFFISPPHLPIYSPEGSAGVDMIRITNPGTKSLFVDAVIGHGLKAERSQEAVTAFATARSSCSVCPLFRLGFDPTTSITIN
jgi:hypothetical protein